jgi:hypothetical protein
MTVFGVQRVRAAVMLRARYKSPPLQ